MLACTLSLTVCPPAGGPAGAIFRPAVGLPWRPTEDVKLINPAIGCLGIPSSRSLASRRGFSSSPTGGKGLRDSCEAVRGDFTNMIHSLFLAPQTLSGRCYLGGVPSPSFFFGGLTQWLFHICRGVCPAVLYGLSAERVAKDSNPRPTGFSWAVSLKRPLPDRVRCPGLPTQSLKWSTLLLCNPEIPKVQEIKVFLVLF